MHANKISIKDYLNNLKEYLTQANSGQNNDPFKITNCEFLDDFTFTGKAIDSLQTPKYEGALAFTFKNVSGTITLKNIDNITNLRFTQDISCLEGNILNVIFENVKADNISFVGMVHGAVSLQFKNVVTTKVETMDCAINSLSFSDSIIEEISIRNTTLAYPDGLNSSLAMELTNSILGVVKFSDVKTISDEHKEGDGKVLIENCFIEKTLSVDTSYLGSLLLSMATPQLSAWWKTQKEIPPESVPINLGTIQKLELSKTTFKEIEVSGCILKELSMTDSSSILSTVSVKNGSTLGQFIFEGYKPVEQTLCNIASLVVENATVETLRIKGNNCAAISKLKFTNALIKKGLIDQNVIESIYMGDLLMRDSFLQINDTSAKKISFSNFTNLGTIHLINLWQDDKGIDTDPVLDKKKDRDEYSNDVPMLELKNTNLGKTHFYGCNFGESIAYSNSSITEITILSTRFPWRFNIHSNSKGDELHKQQSSLLGQLRRVYELNKDEANSIRYNAYHLDIIRKQRKYGWERFALWLNMFTNSYGNDLQRAVMVTFGGSILLYIFYGAARGYITWGGTPNYKYIWYMSLNFLEFISPVRRINLLKPASQFNIKAWNPNNEDIDALTAFVSGLSRIVISYLLVQFVLAFRKYGRKA